VAKRVWGQMQKTKPHDYQVCLVPEPTEGSGAIEGPVGFRLVWLDEQTCRSSGGHRRKCQHRKHMVSGLGEWQAREALAAREE
jgi:hypothetical protein